MEKTEAEKKKVRNEEIIADRPETLAPPVSISLSQLTQKEDETGPG